MTAESNEENTRPIQINTGGVFNPELYPHFNLTPPASNSDISEQVDKPENVTNQGNDAQVIPTWLLDFAIEEPVGQVAGDPVEKTTSEDSELLQEEAQTFVAPAPTSEDAWHSEPQDPSLVQANAKDTPSEEILPEPDVPQDLEADLESLNSLLLSDKQAAAEFIRARKEDHVFAAQARTNLRAFLTLQSDNLPLWDVYQEINQSLDPKQSENSNQVEN